MRIAVFDHVGNWGGGSRFCRAMLLALKKNFPETGITYFGCRSSMEREGVAAEFAAVGIEVGFLASVDLVGLDKRPLKAFRAVLNRISRLLALDRASLAGIHSEIERLAHGYDVAFFPWPYLMECPTLSCPMVGVFHDFNYKYFFGSPVFSEDQYRELNRQMPAWLSCATPVVSSKFTASELAKFYPSAAGKIEIVHLAPFTISAIPQAKALKIVRELGIGTSYVLYPTNLCPHKNLGILLRAIYLLRQRGVEVSLVVTGPGTECVNGKLSAHGVERGATDAAVVGLGYVSNTQIDALIQCAKAVISTSLYEAGNGPGLEAWSHSVPVIMSDMPSFVEHLDVLGVKAQLVDPYNANDIAEKIHFVLANYNQAKVAAELSRESLRRYDWEAVSKQYHEIFCSVVK